MAHHHEMSIDGRCELIVTATGDLTITQYYPAEVVKLPDGGAARAEVVGVPGVKGLQAAVRLLQIDPNREYVDAWVEGAAHALEAAGYKVEVIRE